jgi:diadenosine tetraphosphate (Ap4A) HIT family hydrolase
MDNLVVFESEHFLVKQCSDVSIPGYLIITPKNKVFHFSDLSQEVLKLFSCLLARVEKVLVEVLDVEMIYIAKFAELNKRLHFHIFPRTESILQAYIQDNPFSREGISGPLIFDWSRKHYKVSVDVLKKNKKIIDMLLTIKQRLKST